MSVEMQEMVRFHLTGKRSNGETPVTRPQDVCPALLAPYRRLAELRYDFPLILLDGSENQAFVDTLSGIVNRLLREIAPEGNAGEQLRQHVIRLEHRMRELVAAGYDSTLTALWEKAEKSLLDGCRKSETESLKNSLDAARFALNTDGQAVDCDDRLPSLLMQHIWTKVEAQRTRRSLEQIESLIIRLRNILKVDDLKNGRSRSPQKLKQTLGRRYKDAFDFELMSELLLDSAPHNKLPVDRRRRVRTALTVLESQEFFARGTGDNPTQYRFVFSSTSEALKAYNERLPEIADVVRAIAIAELECENAYRESAHDAYFTGFAVQALAPEDLALFPSYLICLQDSECDTRDRAELMEIAASDLPMKVLLQVSDVLGEPSPADKRPRHGAFMRQLANTFVAPGAAYVLQTASSNLYQQREQLRKGMEYRGPAIFSIFAGHGTRGASLPAYLVAAAAMDSRTFPAFSYDPAAGAGLADRFDIGSNPEIEAAWPRRELRYEDEELQTITEDQAFTLADFAVTDPRYSDYFALAPREKWTQDMLPVANYLDLADEETFEKIPYVAVVDGGNILQRLVVNDSLIRIARRCRDRWHVLQENGGIDNSHATALLLKERAAWEEEKEIQIQAIRAELGTSDPSQPAAATAPRPESDIDIESPVIEDPGEAVISDDPYIDTASCTTCDECTNKNNRMFAYDENKQAYIKDPDAGTYKELVEAAEVCQVAIIHPGKPRNQSEPGLDELIKRAEPFMA